MNAENTAQTVEATMLEAVKQYFIRGDAGRPDVLDLFTDDVQIFFPKFGVTRGKQGFGELAAGLMSSINAIAHDLANFTYTVAPDTVVVEGTTRGTDREGRDWRGGETPGGRFCSVFKFRNGSIVRMHIYLDPDYTSLDKQRFLWGRDRAW
jgi:ketosteroid isomerase-like protein